jgi:toluene monooxygenase system protein E
MALVRRREPAKTWSLLGEVRKRPSDYEVVTSKLHYHYGRKPAPFELDPNTPINAWYLRYREGSPFQTGSWEGFRDPHQLTYQVYVQRQSEREAYLENLVDEFERRNHDASLQTDWVRELDRLYLPARFPMHALQMAALYVAQMAPSSFITNAAYFQAADELRRIQWVAYRAKSLSLEHYPELASSTYTRRRWEDDDVWQPLRESVEKMLVTYDWGEAFVALNLIVKPLFDAVFNVQLAELARSNEDALLALMVADFELDSQRSRDWSVALVQYAVAQRPANTGLLKQWVDQWKPLAYQGMEGLVELFGQAPHPLEPRAVSATVRAAHDAFLARCGLDAVPMVKAELQKSGIDAIGDMVAWGDHFCLFYETKEDLLDALISYCKSGLENKEYCLWVVTEPLTIEEATVALKQAAPDFDSYLADSSVEIVSVNDFFLQGGTFDRKRVTDALFAKLADISARGFDGVRLTGDTSWVTKKDWTPFCELEDGINQVIGNQRLAVLCTYSLATCGANEILDAVRSHQFALVRRQGNWVVIETAAVKRAKAEIERLNEELEQRVVERTSELMEASEELRSMVHSALDAVIGMDADGIITGWNKQAEDIFGWTRSEALGRRMSETIIPMQYRSSHERGLRHFFQTGQGPILNQRIEITALRRDGSEFPVELSVAPLKSGDTWSFSSFVRDISDRKRSEEQLRTSELNLRRMTETIPEMLWSATPDGAVDYCNTRVLDYTGLSQDEVKGAGWMKTIHPDDAENMARAWIHSVESGEPFQFEFRCLRASDGMYRWCDSSALPLRGSDGGILKWYGTVVDRHDRRQAQEDLRNTQAELAHVNRVMTMGELTASIAHEVSQPLAAIIASGDSCTAWLAHEPPNLDKARVAANRMIQAATQASETVHRIRGLFKKTTSMTTSVDVNAVIEDTISLVHFRTQRHNILLRAELDAGVPSVSGDRVQLQQVVLNLVINGIESIAGLDNEPKWIVIRSALSNPGELLVSVEDSGPGIDAAHADRLFAPFFTTKPQGIGMGLPICRSIIEAHGGRLWAAKNEPRGAVFHFTLPTKRQANE